MKPQYDMIEKNAAQIGQAQSEKPHCSPGIKWHLFGYLTIFTAVIIVILWLCQVVFLDSIYKNIMINEITKSAHTLAEAVSDGDYEHKADNIAQKNDICLLLLTMASNDRAVELYSAEAQGNCVIHNTEKSSIFVLYDKAVENGGSKIQHYRYDSTRRIYIGDESERYTSLSEENESIIYSVITSDPSGTPVFILLNSVISPVTATVSTLNKLLTVISLVLIVLSLIMSVVISRMISRPIVKLSGDAKKLATGDYEVNFSANGYREIGELANSLAYAEKELSKVDSLRRELIANISHDLRTPLTMISGYAEIMRDLPDENTPENLQIIIDESDRLKSLVNDVLDISKLESGSRQVCPSKFDLTDELRNALDRYNKLMGQKGYSFDFHTDSDVWVETDKTMLMQVFHNLISNAITYTGADKNIYVNVQTDQPIGTVRVSVTDTGEGIAPEKLPLIWDRYYKVDKVHRRAAVGTGLGLSIVRKSMELLGGSYGVRSEQGKGSTFWFELPYTMKNL